MKPVSEASPAISVPADSSPLRVMVASTVYGFENELDQIVGTLRTYGYMVWNSHAGTIPTDPRKSNLENCLDAVRQCDLFVGLIRQFYGSGVIGATSITHEEMRLAVQLDKPRWVLAHENVFLARQLLKPFLAHFAPLDSVPFKDNRGWWQRRFGRSRPTPLPPLPSMRNNPVLDDLRILELFAEMTRTAVPLRQRTGNWVQPYRHLGDVLRYITTNLGDSGFVRDIVQEGQT